MEKLQVIEKRLQEINDKANQENRDLTKVEQKEFDDLLKESNEIRSKIPANRSKIENTDFSDVVVKPYVCDKRNSMGKVLDKTYADYGEFKNNADFFTALINNDLRTQKRALTVGGNAGILVPDRTAAEVFDAGLEEEIIRPRASIETFESNEKIIIPEWNNYNHTEKLYNGFRKHYTGESVAVTAEEPTFGYSELEPNYLTLDTNVSMQLAMKAGNANVIMGSMQKAVSFFMDSDFITGNGVGKPTGLLNCACKISVARETANEISFVDISNMLARIYGRNYNNAIWLANNAIIPQLTQLTAPSGSTMPVYNGDTLYGKQIIFTEKCKNLGTEGDIILVDLSDYRVCMWRSGLAMLTTDAYRWNYNEISLKAIVGIDGNSKWKTAITPENGNSQSHIVTLSA